MKLYKLEKMEEAVKTQKEKDEWKPHDSTTEKIAEKIMDKTDKTEIMKILEEYQNNTITNLEP